MTLHEIPEVEIAGTTNKKGMIRKTAHKYEKIGLSGIYGQVKETIILEATWLGTSDPHIHLPISSYITDMMVAAGQEIIVEQYALAPFPAATWQQIRSPYQTTFRSLVTGILPVEEELVRSLEHISKRLQTITWTISP